MKLLLLISIIAFNSCINSTEKHPEKLYSWDAYGKDEVLLRRNLTEKKCSQFLSEMRQWWEEDGYCNNSLTGDHFKLENK